MMRRALVLICVVAFVSRPFQALSQMGNPANGPSRISNQDLDPARRPGVLTAESTLHQPLPEQYIWTKADAVPSDVVPASGWFSGGDKDLVQHYFRKTFMLSSIPEHATLYIAGPRSSTIFLNGQKVDDYSSNLDFPMGIRVYHCDVTKALKSGSNVLAIEAVRGPGIGSGADNRLSIQQTRGEVLAVKILPAILGTLAAPLLISDDSWKAMLNAPSDWSSPHLDDSGWAGADSLGGIESSIEFYSGTQMPACMHGLAMMVSRPFSRSIISPRCT